MDGVLMSKKGRGGLFPCPARERNVTTGNGKKRR